MVSRGLWNLKSQQMAKYARDISKQNVDMQIAERHISKSTFEDSLPHT